MFGSVEVPYLSGISTITCGGLVNSAVPMVIGVPAIARRPVAKRFVSAGEG